MTIPALWRWSPGRQGTGYCVLPLARGKTWDVYVIDYPSDSYVPGHRDPVKGKKHFRLNLTVLGDVGRFWTWSVREEFGLFWQLGRLVLFRPDLNPHGVLASTSRRVVLSIGWVR